MNRQIRQLAGGLMACYVLLFVALNYWQVGRQEDLNANFDNTRAIRREYEQPRGPIETVDRVVAARSVPNPPGSEFEYQREYPTGELYAHLTGYYTFAFGSTGLERTQNAVLTGSTGEQRLRNLTGIITGADASGTVRMTVRDDLQQVARDALGEREGSVVVIEPSTGAVRAMWSFPSYDPNLVADQDFEAARAVLTFYNASPADPLLGNAYQQRYMPGSTFKILTTSIGLQNGALDLQTTFPDESSWVPPQTDNPIENFEGTTCGGDLTEVFTRSCNIPFAKTAVQLGPDAMIDGVDDWGVGETTPDRPAPTGGEHVRRHPPTSTRSCRCWRCAGFGGNEVQMVPLHMAMVAATVANDGVMMKPYVVDSTYDHSGRVLDRTEPEVWKTPISPQIASTLNTLMQSVATSGTASCCIALEGGIPVAAKTGTAQLNQPGEPERSHAWIVAFAPADDPQYAVAVMLEGTNAEISASTGGQLAGPIAKTVLDAALSGGG